MPKNSQRAKWNTANARLANKPFDNLFDGSFRSTQEIADSMQSFAPVIQWSAVSQKWHVTLSDWTDEVYTGDTIRQALEAAEQSMKADECQGPCELGGVHEFAEPIQICSKCGTRRLC